MFIQKEKKMKAEIDITIEDNKLYIREVNCTPCEYDISENMPAMIDDVCEHLHDYLEGLG